jgi:integrase
MKAIATVSNVSNTAGSEAQPGNATQLQAHATKSAPRFEKVKDGRRQPVRGLWKRGERYYARLAVENPLTGVKAIRRIPLEDKDGNAVHTVPQAIAELRRLQTHRGDNTLRTVERTPKFTDYAARYLEFIGSGQGAKKPATVEKEKSILSRWTEHLGQLRLDQIKRVHVNRFVEKRLSGGASARTINLDVISFRVVLKRALSDGLVQRLPTEGLKPLKTEQGKRSLFTAEDLEKLCTAAFQNKENADGKTVPLTENAQQLIDYVRLMAYSGCRRNEALGLQWDDVDATKGLLNVRRQITRRGEESLKNRQARTVDFNPKLQAHLADMASRRAPDSKWLFPSPQRGDKDIPAKSFRESLDMVKDRAKLPGFGFHDCRHHFISMCVMSGVDFMTLAAWVGHQDGGVLIGKVYGHLANEHRKAMADRVSFEPIVLPQQQAA